MRWTLSSKITLSLGGLLLVLSVLVAGLTFGQMRRSAIDDKQALMDVLNYTFETLLSQDAIPSLQRVIENEATTNSDVQKLLVVDREGIVLASSDRREVGKDIEAPLLREFLSGASDARWQRVTRATDEALIILQPLRGSGFLGGMSGDIVGVAEMTLSLDAIQEEARASALQLLGISLGSFTVFSGVLVVVLRLLVTRPVRELAVVAQRIQGGDRKLRSQIRRKDEIGLLSSAFNEMASELETTLRGLEDQVAARTADLEAERGALEQALSELKATTAARLALADTVRELSTPVIRLYDRILVLPLVGNIDTERARQIEASLLAGIEQHGASEIILDLTGVPFVDTAVAASLLRAASAARLLGAGVTIVGITAQVAQSIVHLGVDFSGIATRADLQSGLIHALRSLGLSVGRVREKERSGGEVSLGE
jgi:anti-anti-sigma factor